MRYDLLVIGDDRAGRETALLAARLRRYVAIVRPGPVARHERIDDEFVRRGIDVYSGEARFAGPHAVTVIVHGDAHRLEAETIVVATGARPARPDRVLFDGRRAADGDQFAVVGNTKGLNLPALGVQLDERGRLWCNDDLQTWVPHIYGAGDVVGFPRWVGTPTDQARRIVAHAFPARLTRTAIRNASATAWSSDPIQREDRVCLHRRVRAGHPTFQ